MFQWQLLMSILDCKILIFNHSASHAFRLSSLISGWHLTIAIVNTIHSLEGLQDDEETGRNEDETDSRGNVS